MNCDKKGPQFWIIFRVEKGPNFSSFHETKRSKIIYFNDNVGPFLSNGDKNLDLFNREMVKNLDLFNRGCLTKGGAVAPFAPPLATPLVNAHREYDNPYGVYKLRILVVLHVTNKV